MAKPLVAVVGRPNVGKSTLFNAIVNKRISIVEDIPGVTRDRIYFDGEWLNHEFTMIDTGGIEFMNDDAGSIPTMMRYQAQLAIDEADVIMFVVDGKQGNHAEIFQRNPSSRRRSACRMFARIVSPDCAETSRFVGHVGNFALAGLDVGFGKAFPKERSRRTDKRSRKSRTLLAVPDAHFVG